MGIPITLSFSEEAFLKAWVRLRAIDAVLSPANFCLSAASSDLFVEHRGLLFGVCRPQFDKIGR